MPTILARSMPAAVLSLAALQVAAHHSTASFDLERELTLDGVVTQFDWANPHVYVHVKTSADNGEPATWAVEAQALAGMVREGWSTQSFAPGEHVIVVANPSKNPNRTIALGRSILKDDGTSLYIPRLNSRDPAASADTPALFVAENLSGLWVSRWNPDVATGFLRAGAAWLLTARGSAAMETYGPELNPAKDCVPEPIPQRMIWPLPVTIELGEETTMIRFETGGEERAVHMNRDSHDGAPFTYFGHSIGSWDGDALVVDTSHFAEHRRGNAVGGLASGRQKHLVERFDLGPGRTYLSYTFRLSDPEYLAESVTGTLELGYRPDFRFAALPCDLEVARRYLEE